MREFLVFVLAAAAGSSAADRPNIVYIMSDEHAAHAIGAYGSHCGACAGGTRLFGPVGGNAQTAAVRSTQDDEPPIAGHIVVQ